MQTQDYEPFIAEFARLAHALDPYKKTPEHVRAKADAYFHALKKYPLPELCAKADAWMQRESKFPKPVEWANQVVPLAPVEYRAFTSAESEEYRRAERLRYEDTPCGCSECVFAEVANVPRRFVPKCDSWGGELKARDGDRVVVEGRWIHGQELARWHAARRAFFAMATGGGPIGRVALALVSSREPGSDDE